MIELKLQQHEISKKSHSNYFVREKIEIIYSSAINNRRSTIILRLKYLDDEKSFEKI